MTTVATLLEKKGNRVVTISPEATVYAAIKLMDKEHIGALAVVEAGMLVGLISERDYARKVILRGRTSVETQVKEIMTSHVYRASPNHTVEQCMAAMTEHRVRHLPVVNDGKLIGMLSIGDLVKEIISEQEFTIEQLVHYISSTELH